MNVLFIFAHLDDETILSYGTMKKHCSQNDNVEVLSLCKNSRKDDNNRKLRLNVYNQIVANNSINTKLHDNYDLELDKKTIDDAIDNEFEQFRPDIIYTHSIKDLHYEHRLVAESVLLHCRKTKNCMISSLYMTISPTYCWTYAQYGQFIPNYFVDITQFIEEKKKALQLYDMELPTDNNDIRSAESVIDWNRQFGRMMNVGYCEAYQQIFKMA